MSVSNLETSNLETSVPTVSGTQPKRVAEPIYAYTISWGWLIAGVLGVFGLGGIAGATHYWQTANMPQRVMEVVQRMVEESEQAKEAADEAADLAERGRLMIRSFQLRTDAANLLNNFRRANPEAAGEDVLVKLYNILESLYNDHGGGTTAVGLQRGAQLNALAIELAGIVDESQAIKYRIRILELEWDRRRLSDIVHRGKELLSAAQALRESEQFDAARNDAVLYDDARYNAMRYIALAFFERLPVQPYDPEEYQLPPIFPETMDVLLGRLNSQRPDDIEIASRYAEFLVNVGGDDHIHFTASASASTRNRSVSDRLAMAREHIDIMVQQNRDNPVAYLARYRFITSTARFLPPGEALDIASLDLLRVLELAPSSGEGLFLSGLHAFRQVGIARRNGEWALAREWEDRAEGYLRRMIRDNPGDPRGYLQLGEYLWEVRRNHEEAIAVWNEGLANSGIRSRDEELLGRLIMLLLQQGMIEEARGRLGDLARTINEMRVSRPADVSRTQDVHRLLTAWLYRAEATQALARVEAARRENRLDEVQRLRALVQQRQREAVQMFESVLLGFGWSEEDFMIESERRSIYFSVLPLSLLQLGEIKLEMGQWDSAVSHFRRATRFNNDVLLRALIGMSAAFQQMNQMDQAIQILSEATRIFPENMHVRRLYAMALFRSVTTSNVTSPAELARVQRELESLESFRDELPQPWTLDFRLIHLRVAQASLTNQAETIQEATIEAVHRLRALEGQAFPPDAAGNVRNYIDHLPFVTELIEMYRGLAARADFDRLLGILRAFPDGEAAYYEARINDAFRRNSLNEAAEIINEAIESPRLSHAQRERLIETLQNMRGENQDNASPLDQHYEQLKATFSETPELLRPQALLALANMSLDRGELERAQQIRERLERMEGLAGTNWRSIAVRQMLANDDPDFDEIRAIQAVVVGHRPDWDVSYILSALIEERYLEANPESTASRERLITAYRNAIQRGSLAPRVWQRLIEHLEIAGRTEDARTLLRDAVSRGVIVAAGQPQFPPPYDRMYSQVREAILTGNAIEADTIAQQVIRLAEMRGERSELIHALHFTLGRTFLDARMFDSAIRHFSETARRGGQHVYPLAQAMAISGDVDGGFTLLLDKIDLRPSETPFFLPAIFMLIMNRIQPSEAILERIDTLMSRIERGERLTLSGTIEPSDEDFVIPLGTRWVEYRIIRSLIIRFPGNSENLDTSAIQFIAPEEFMEELAEEEELARQVQEISRPAITNIPGGFFVEWAAPVAIAAIQLGRELTGPLEIMFDISSVESIAEVDNRPPPIADSDMVVALTDYWIIRGRPERAIPLYEESLALGNLDDGRNIVFRNNLAMLTSQILGEHARALEIIEGALATMDDANLLSTEGLISNNAESPAGAVLANLLGTKGLILINAGNPAEAIPALLQAVELSHQHPAHSRYRIHLAYAFYRGGDSESARQWFNSVGDQSIPLPPNMSSEDRVMFDTLQLAFPPAAP